MGMESAKLNEYKQELSSIIREMEKEEYYVRHNYKNVGNEQCAQCMQSVINRYYIALKTLNSIDPTLLDRLKAAREAEIAQSAKNTKTMTIINKPTTSTKSVKSLNSTKSTKSTKSNKKKK